MTACDRCSDPSLLLTTAADGSVKGICATCAASDLEAVQGDASPGRLPEWMERRCGGDPIGTGLPGYPRKDGDR